MNRVQFCLFFFFLFFICFQKLPFCKNKKLVTSTVRLPPATPFRPAKVLLRPRPYVLSFSRSASPSQSQVCLLNLLFHNCFSSLHQPYFISFPFLVLAFNHKRPFFLLMLPFKCMFGSVVIRIDFELIDSIKLIRV